MRARLAVLLAVLLAAPFTGRSDAQMPPPGEGRVVPVCPRRQDAPPPTRPIARPGSIPGRDDESSPLPGPEEFPNQFVWVPKGQSQLGYYPPCVPPPVSEPPSHPEGSER